MGNRRTLKQAFQEPSDSGLKSFIFEEGNASHELPRGQVPVEAMDDREIIVPISKIHSTFSFTPNGKPLRHYYDLDALKEWGETDLKPNGVRTALWVRPRPDMPEEYELVAGLRRLTACKEANITEVPVKVFDWNDEEAFAAAFDENDKRKDFSRLEEVDNILNLLSSRLGFKQDEVISLLYKMDNEAKGKTTQNVLGSPKAEEIVAFFAARGQLTWKSFVSTRLPLLKKPPEILEAVRTSKLDYTKALEIAKVKDPQVRVALLTKASQDKLSLSQVKAAIKETSQPQDNVPVHEHQVDDDLKKRFRTALRRADKVEAWADPQKMQKLFKLLRQLEKLLT